MLTSSSIPKGHTMTDLNPEEVRKLLASLGLDITPDDLPEVTHRVNAQQEALGNLEHQDLDAVEPVSVFWLTEDL